MKVECVKILGPDGEESQDNNWIRIGGIYTVLSVSIYFDRTSKYRIVTTEKNNSCHQAILVPIGCFKVISTHVPSNWSIHICEHGGVLLGPGSWNHENFWVDFFDDDQVALDIFEREKAIMLREDP